MGNLDDAAHQELRGNNVACDTNRMRRAVAMALEGLQTYFRGSLVVSASIQVIREDGDRRLVEGRIQG